MSNLKKYYRKPKLFITLPSKFHFYDRSKIKNTEVSAFDEVGILPLTTMNELQLKNPEALLNGSAIEDIIRDCTTIDADPRKLLKCDIDALLVGIKMASGDNHFQDFDVKCQNTECKHEFVYKRDLDKVLNSITHHDEEYAIEMEGGDLFVYITPATLQDHMSIENQSFEDRKKIDEIQRGLKSMRDGADSEDYEKFQEEEQKLLNMVNGIFKDVTYNTIDYYARSVLKIAMREKDEETGEDIWTDETDIDEIKQWLAQLDKTSFKKLKESFNNINNKGLEDTDKIKCPECDHEWVQHFNINMTDFFVDGS